MRIDRSCWPVVLVVVGWAALACPRLAGGDEGEPAEASTEQGQRSETLRLESGKKVRIVAGDENLKPLLLTAMQNNPDILVGQTTVYEAEAELNRVVLDVTRKIVALRAELKSRQLEVDEVVNEFEIGKGVSPAEVEARKAKVTPLIADLRYLLGLRRETAVVGKGNAAAGEAAPPAEDDLLKMSIDEAVTRGIRQNPDVQLAKAKLSSAEAQLKRTRLDVARKVVTLRKLIESDGVRYRNLRDAAAKVKNAVPPQDIASAQAKVNGEEAELDYVLGRSPLDQPQQKTEEKAEEK